MKIIGAIIQLILRIPFAGRLIVGLGERALKLAWRIPYLSRHINCIAVSFLAAQTPPRPRPYSLWSPEPKPEPPEQQGPISDYTSWPSLTNREFSGRHLPPAPESYTRSLPADAAYDRASGQIGEITSLFKRTVPMTEGRSTVLFMFFAQWFTDSILRVHPVDRRRNTSNHDVDLCQIYGLDEKTARILRTMKDGKLRSQNIAGEEYPEYLHARDSSGRLKIRDEFKCLPYASEPALAEILKDCPKNRLDKCLEKFYATGLERGNSSIGYVAISTIFLREHNRLCAMLKAAKPDWKDERLFQTARMINIVILLKLVVEEYINHISGHKLFRLDHTFAETKDWYRTNWIAIEFDLLYRWHGLVPDTIAIDGASVPASTFRNNNELLESKGVSAVINAASLQPAGRVGLHNTPDFLWGAEYASIKMSRDFRLRSYNDYRERFGLNRLTSFSELTNDTTMQGKLETLYGKNVDNLEYLVGLFAEDATQNSLFGDLLVRMVAYDAFTQIYTNPLLSKNVYNADTFTAEGLAAIESTESLQMLIDRNIKSGTSATASFG